MANPAELRQYEQDKAKYERSLIEYRENLRKWNSLSLEQQQQLDEEAESANRMMWSLSVATLINFLLYICMGYQYRDNNFLIWVHDILQEFSRGIYEFPQYSGDDFWIRWGILSAIIYFLAAIGKRFFGLLAKSISFSLFAGVICYFGFEWIKGNVAQPPSNDVQFWVTVCVLFIAFLAGLIGAYHASGAPKEPSPPIRPN
jgi:hypothetical protein